VQGIFMKRRGKKYGKRGGGEKGGIREEECEKSW
jgi:hypothetical protein